MAPSGIVHRFDEDQTRPSMMAWRVHEFGPPEVMRFERVLRPDPGPGELLVEVKAAGVGPWDGWIRAGKSALPISWASSAFCTSRSIRLGPRTRATISHQFLAKADETRR